LAACEPQLTHELYPLIWLARRRTRSKVAAGTPPFPVVLRSPATGLPATVLAGLHRKAVRG
jgi:hypothetical protein